MELGGFGGTMRYTKFTSELTNKEYIFDNENGSFIPVDPANSDYQRYLRWLEDPTAEEGGTLS